MKKILSTYLCVFVLVSLVSAQTPVDKGNFIEYTPGFYYNTIMNDIMNGLPEGFENQKFPKIFVANLDNKEFPNQIADYKTLWHSLPKSQGNTGTCWCYAATSFMESEVYRLHNVKTDLSEMFTVYWEYVERAEDFVNTRGETYFAQGSESNAIPKIWKKYGIVPESAYSGLLNNRKYHSHEEMEEEMIEYLNSVKESENWNIEEVLNSIKGILNSHMGTPPEMFVIDGVTYSPKSYLESYLKIRMNDYFSFMSTMMWPYYEKHELVEPDNWWHDDNYYNLPVEVFTNLLKEAVSNSYSVCICGDVSEPGHDRFSEVAVIPDFDIPAEYINEHSREKRLQDGSTTDDHCIHVVGYTEYNDETWFLIKDSGSGAFDGPNKGYRFYHEDYIRLKMMNFLMHKDTAKDILDKIIK
ncbi:MAG TPA: C1 family peptidase [Bacteroidales bacterium]|jgi:bleomycin hydrolase|nr:C1 family peptidase [Bacteroidales bacterium]MDY0160666.1 C1 family peptidase [Bacteroidales bacterium]HXK81131.1 C1 family peptidase [Bacteroidales bacterium]